VLGIILSSSHKKRNFTMSKDRRLITPEEFNEEQRKITLPKGIPMPQDPLLRYVVMEIDAIKSYLIDKQNQEIKTLVNLQKFMVTTRDKFTLVDKTLKKLEKLLEPRLKTVKKK